MLNDSLNQVRSESNNPQVLPRLDIDDAWYAAHIHEHLNTIAANQAAAVTCALDTLASERGLS